MKPKRKSNRLADYSYSQPGTYFVTVCTKEKKCILNTIVGADDHIGPRVKLTAAGAVVERYTKSVPGIGAYVIMPNHVHMMLHISSKDVCEGPVWQSTPANMSIPSLIRSWKTLISKELGQSIWQRSYYDHIIRNENDYWTRVQYIQENPAKWYYDDYYRW